MHLIYPMKTIKDFGYLLGFEKSFVDEYGEDVYTNKIDKELEEDMNVLISACLLGINCRYDGGENLIKEIEKLKERYNLIPVCPEIFGGLSTPREPAEIIDGKVINRRGEDVTENFVKGAKETLYLAKLFNCKYAILKERSPSCGYGKIYDGTFSGKLVDGNGITAELLAKNGIEIIGESQIDKLLNGYSHKGE